MKPFNVEVPTIPLNEPKVGDGSGWEPLSMHENWPYYPMDKVEKVPRGEIVRLEIGIWATGIEFEAGESIRFQICGRHQGINNFGTTEFTNNKGKHVVHFGGEYDSHVVLPFT
jgi:predicted acyl esterase